MKSTGRTVLVLLVIIMITAGPAAADKPGKKFKLGLTERFRFVSWDNTITLDDSSGDAFSFTRHRTSLSAQWFPMENLELGIKFTNEFRYYMSPKNRDFNLHEVIFDQLYVKWKKIGSLPLTLTLGRQNIIMGEGFVVLDSNPLDGSRSIGFNAVRFDYNLNKNHTLTAFYTYQPDTDDLLPVINSKDQPMVDQPEHGMGLYWVGNFNKTRIDAYVIRKNIDDTGTKPVDAGINAFGARVSLPLANKLSLTAEATYENGKIGTIDQTGLGGYFHLDYKFGGDVPFFNTLTLGGIYYSGDDPETEEYEGWEPLFARWPKWSESYIYTLIIENGVAYWSNLNSIYLSCLMDVMDSMKLRLTWHHLGANQTGTGNFTAGDGKSRGDLFIGRLDFRINKHTTGHFVWEHFNPGDFYFEGADAAHWLRFELMFKF